MAYQIVPSTLSLAANTGDSTLRSFITYIHDILIAGGWIRTTDTGQVDELTVTNPNTATSVGYSIFRSNDGGVGLSEIFIKLTWYSNTTSGKYGLKMEVGFGTDGSGNFLTPYTISYDGSTPTYGWITTDWYISCGLGWLMFHIGTTTGIEFFSLERLRANNGDFLDIVSLNGAKYNGTYNRSNQCLSPTQIYPLTTSLVTVYPTNSNSVISAKVGCGFTFGVLGPLSNPLMNVIIIPEKTTGTPQIGIIGEVFNINIWGESHNYLLLAGNVNGYVPIQGSGFSHLLRWE